MVAVIPCLLISPLAGAEPSLEPVAALRSKVAKGGDPGLVRVRGVVTFFSEQTGIAFLQDETAGIAFQPRGLKEGRPVKGGETVELEGITLVHDGMLMLCGQGSTRAAPFAPAVSWIDDEVRVRARTFELSSAAEMRVNAELIRSSGVVRRAVKQGSTGMRMEVSSPAGYAVVRLPWAVDDATAAAWVDQEAEFDGVVVCKAEKRLLPEDADAAVFVSSQSHWRPRPHAIDEVLAKPAVTAAQLAHEMPLNSPGSRLHVTGSVTAVRPPLTLFLRTAEGSLEISTRQARQFHEGDKIAAACWLQNRQGRLILADGVCRSLGQTEPVQPLTLTSAAAAVKAGHGELVQFMGLVRDIYRDHAQGRLLVVLNDGGTCAVRWEAPVTPEALSNVRIGAVMELAGICELGKAAKSAEQGANFTLRPRGDADLRVVMNAPWWTRQRLSRALWTVLILAGVAVPGVIFLRWKLWKQELKIREIERGTASAAERQRIAREFHDSLQQQLYSASLHVDTLREASESSPEILPALLDDLSAMLRHCQVEARNSIWDLRADSQFREGVATSLRSWVAMRQRLADGTQLAFETEGEEKAGLPADTCLQVLRITQEAVNNALAHAGARKVVVRLKHAEGALEVLVEDDGRGFNTKMAPTAAEGHYGLSMLQERALRIQGRIDLRSEKDRGTCVRLVVPFSLLPRP